MWHRQMFEQCVGFGYEKRQRTQGRERYLALDASCATDLHLMGYEWAIVLCVTRPEGAGLPGALIRATGLARGICWYMPGDGRYLLEGFFGDYWAVQSILVGVFASSCIP